MADTGTAAVSEPGDGAREFPWKAEHLAAAETVQLIASLLDHKVTQRKIAPVIGSSTGSVSRWKDPNPADLALPVSCEPLTADEARAITEQIKIRAATLRFLIARVFLGRVWIPLGYPNWDTYCGTELDSTRLRLPREERAEMVAWLREETGMSPRAIASALGVDPKTARNDLAASGGEKSPPAEDVVDPKEARTTGSDGKSYPAHKPKPAAPSPRPKPSAVIPFPAPQPPGPNVEQEPLEPQQPEQPEPEPAIEDALAALWDRVADLSPDERVRAAADLRQLADTCDGTIPPRDHDAERRQAAIITLRNNFGHLSVMTIQDLITEETGDPTNELAGGIADAVTRKWGSWAAFDKARRDSNAEHAEIHSAIKEGNNRSPKLGERRAKWARHLSEQSDVNSATGGNR
jgi:hypothetical protein